MAEIKDIKVTHVALHPLREGEQPGAFVDLSRPDPGLPSKVLIYSLATRCSLLQWKGPAIEAEIEDVGFDEFPYPNQLEDGLWIGEGNITEVGCDDYDWQLSWRRLAVDEMYLFAVGQELWPEERPRDPAAEKAAQWLSALYQGPGRSDD